MKKNVIDYKVLSGSLSDVERQVREHIQQDAGWRPSGNLVVKGDNYCQPIMRLE